jgi:hypothetical protein
VNYLREIPEELFDLPMLSPNRLRNPSDWISASEAHCQLSEEWPAHAARLAPDGVNNLVVAGEGLGKGLSKIADPNLDEPN